MAKKAAETKIVAYKGFDKDFRCRGFQYEVGKTYEHPGPVVACESGFHACEHPLDIFNYYPPTSRFAVVTQSGEIARHGGDTKIASAKITIDAEIHLPDLVAAAVKWVFDRAKWVDGPVATKANEAATASGGQGAATASHSTAVAMVSGWEGRAKGVKGSALFLVHRDDEGNITHAKAAIVGKSKIKPDVWYALDETGRFVES